MIAFDTGLPLLLPLSMDIVAYQRHLPYQQWAEGVGLTRVRGAFSISLLHRFQDYHNGLIPLETECNVLSLNQIFYLHVDGTA